jgi:putative sterol carrier protein
MAAFLTDEWFAMVAEEAAALPSVAGADLVMQHVISGSPHGKVQAVLEVHDGRVAEVRAGKRADASCTVTWTYADALAALRGDTTLDVAFMRGDLKVEGDYSTFLLGLRPVFASEAGAKVLAAVRAQTD